MLTQRTKPKALVVTMVHWAATTRLCLALLRSGLDVAAVAPADHGVHKLKIIRRHFVCNPHAGATSAVTRAIAAWSPDIVIPADDPSIHCMHQIYRQALRGSVDDAPSVAALIAASLGDPASFALAEKKSAFVAFAKAEGIAVPDTDILADVADLRERSPALGFPLVLKVDGSWGGLGVRIVRDLPEAERAFAELEALSDWKAVAKRMLKGLSVEPLRQWLASERPAITMQRYVPGLPANRAVACWEGEVLAGLSVEALQTAHSTGPATVIRVVDSAEMEEVAARAVGRLKLSGFVGFDFIVEEASNRSLLIEMNSRPTPICHLTLDYGSDLAGALAARLAGRPRRQLCAAADGKVIALFPQECWRDPQSDYLRSAYHDVPWEEPEFIATYALPVRSDPASWVDAVRFCSRIMRRALHPRGGEARIPALPASLPIAPLSSSLDRGG